MTNIDLEHIATYGGGLADLQQAFLDFANKVPFYGAAIACVEDRNLAAILPQIRRLVVTYGLDDPRAQIVGAGVELGAFGGRCQVYRRMPSGMELLGRLELAVPGRHNLQNALAAVAVS